jgi:hypothetical protein
MTNEKELLRKIILETLLAEFNTAGMSENIEGSENFQNEKIHFIWPLFEEFGTRLLEETNYQGDWYTALKTVKKDLAEHQDWDWEEE